MSAPTGPDGLPDLVAALRDADARRGLFAPGEPVVVGVSGGADSVALLHVLIGYASERDLALHVAHLDHMLRPDSVDDAAFVGQVAHAAGLPSTLAARDVQALAAELGRGLEDAARAARYAFLAETAAHVGATVVAVAHTADDQAETVLMNFLRGSGLAGLAGMRPRSDFPLPPAAIASLARREISLADERRPVLVRPLLDVWRAEIVAWLSARGLGWREDASNRDRRFLRNRLRHDVIPRLEAINPRLTEALVRTSATVADDLAVLEARTDAAWSLVARGGADEVTLAVDALTREPVAVRRRLLRRAVAVVRGAPTDLGFEHVAAALRLAESGQTGDAVDLPGKVRLVRTPDALVLSPVHASLPPSRLSDEVVPLAVPGETTLPGGWAITALVRAPRAGDLVVAHDPWSAVLDADLAAGGLGARARLPGDRIQAVGMGGHHKSLQDLFVDARIPRHERDAWPVVVCGDRVAWIPGLRLDARTAARPETRRALVLTARAPGRAAGAG